MGLRIQVVSACLMIPAQSMTLMRYVAMQLQLQLLFYMTMVGTTRFGCGQSSCCGHGIAETTGYVTPSTYLGQGGTSMLLIFILK